MFSTCSASKFKSIPSLLPHLRPRCSSPAPPPALSAVHHHLSAFFRLPPPSSHFSLVAALKSSSHPSQPPQLHSLILKSSLHSNIFILNSLINLYLKFHQFDVAASLFGAAPALDTASWNTFLVAYVKSHRLMDARKLFDKMPLRDCISFTTLIMGYTQHGALLDALALFQAMYRENLSPNEVTLATVVASCASLRAVRCGRATHGIAQRTGLEAFVLVSTNLVHLYAACSSLADAGMVFGGMLERNVVTWNVMLNGYVKACLVNSARELFGRMPERDLVSWSTMIDGYVRANMLDEALVTYCEMQLVGIRPSEVTVVDLLSVCGRSSADHEGLQLHGVILKSGLDAYDFIQATIIHFYAACKQIELAHMQFYFGDKNISSWNALIAGYIRNEMVDLAKRLFDDMPERDVVSWSSMIAGYVQSGQFMLALDVFRDMQVSGPRPNEITMVSVVSAVAHSGNLKQGKWIHRYIQEHSIPLNDNLSAGLIDMYAKCGNVEKALEVFNQIRDQVTSVCPWNAVICGLATHGHANLSLSLFEDLQETSIKLNSITFIGVLCACCHAGLVETGKKYFAIMKNVYSVDPNIKHYGCMVDLLGRAGKLEEAELLIKSMPMEADVVIWGSILAASKMHGNVDIGERAAENLARLEPSHGAGRILLSNIYAEAGRWDEVLLVRREMQSARLKKLPGYSGVV